MNREIIATNREIMAMNGEIIASNLSNRNGNGHIEHDQRVDMNLNGVHIKTLAARRVEVNTLDKNVFYCQCTLARYAIWSRIILQKACMSQTEHVSNMSEIPTRKRGTFYSTGAIIRLHSQQSHTYEEVEAIAQWLLEKVKSRPQFGIICGSGMGGLGDLVENREVISYEEIPGFLVSTVPGHAGNLIFGKLQGKQVVLMQGRTHLYEGYSVQKITLPVRVMKLMGVSVLISTNAVGGINPDYNVGDIMIIKDHFNVPGFAAVNPLVGPNDERFGPRFPSTSDAYDREFRRLAKQKAKELGYDSFVREGVYCCLGGPCYESVTESRFLRLVGVDSTGMSTVPEVLVAKHCGMRVLGLSLVTNKCIMDYDSEAFANHEEVLETAKMRSKDLQRLAAAIVRDIKI